MYGRRNVDHVSVGMRKPSGEYERPIRATRLFWTKPGRNAVCFCFATDYLFYNIPQLLDQLHYYVSICDWFRP